MITYENFLLVAIGSCFSLLINASSINTAGKLKQEGEGVGVGGGSYKPSQRTKCAEDELCEWLSKKCPFLTSKQGRPVNNQSEPVQLIVDLYIKRLLDLNDKDLTLSFHGIIAVSWQMPQCSVWSKASLSHIHETALSYEARKVGLCIFSKELIWYPSVYLTNAAADVATLFESYTGKTIAIYQNGRAQLFAPGRFDILCSFDFRAFPFDIQTCYVEFFSSSSKDLAIFSKLNIDFDGVTFTPELENWQLIGYTSNEKQLRTSSDNYANFMLTFRRKSAYFFLPIFVPLVLIMSLQISVLILSPHLPDRPVLSALVLLASQLSKSHMVSSNHIYFALHQPVYLLNYIHLNMTISVLITIYTSTSWFLSHRNQAANNNKRTIVFVKWRNFKLTKFRFIDLIAGVIAVFLLFIINGVYFLCIVLAS